VLVVGIIGWYIMSAMRSSQMEHINNRDGSYTIKKKLEVLLQVCSIVNAVKKLWAVKVMRVYFDFTAYTFWYARLRAFKYRMLRTIFGPKRDEVREEWRRVRNRELYALYSSPNTSPVIKSRRLRLARPVARMGRGAVHTGFLVGKI
jgi:hypothetical protein